MTESSQHTRHEPLWTNVGTAVVPETDRDAFLASLDGVEWSTRRGEHPTMHAIALRDVIAEFEITPVTAIAYNLLHGNYSVLGVRTRHQSMFFIDTGTMVTPVVILALPAPVGSLCGCGVQLPPTGDLDLHQSATGCEGKR